MLYPDELWGQACQKSEENYAGSNCDLLVRTEWIDRHTWRIEATHPGNKPAWVPDLAWIGHMAETQSEYSGSPLPAINFKFW